MKNKSSFYLDNLDTGFKELQDFMSGVENIERVFNVEFAAGEKDGEFLFYSDFLNTEKEDMFLNEFDGFVLYSVFRYKNKVINTSITPVIFEVYYDDIERIYTKNKITKI